MREQKSGSIVYMASDAAKTATPGETIAGAGMAAIVLFSRTLAMEAKRDGIRVNALTPAPLAGTPTADLVPRRGLSGQTSELQTESTALGCAATDAVSGR